LRRSERVADLDGVLDRDARRHRARLDHLRDRLPGHQLHDDRALSVVLDDVIDRRDVRVIERRERLRLALEAGADLRILEQGARQDLQGHLATEARVARTVDFRHATGADCRQRFVWAEACLR
jgi:hypothetical protein